MPIVRKFNPCNDDDYLGIRYSYCYLDHSPDDPDLKISFRHVQKMFFNNSGMPSDVDEDAIPTIIDVLVDIRINDALIRHGVKETV